MIHGAARPTLCVLMPNYNHGRFLPRALGAVFSQSRLADRVVVIDDASTDNSREVLAGYAVAHPELTVLENERNLGVVANVNRLAELCDCTHAIFLAADDVVLPGLFETTMALFETHPQAGLCSGLIRVLDENDTDLGPLVTPVPLDKPGYLSPAEALHQLLTDGQWIVNNSTTYRMDALRGCGGFKPELEAFSDGLISDVIALRHGALYIPEDAAYWRINPRGYACSTCSDLERITRVMRKALDLMRTDYADVFPESYRKLFATSLCKRYHPGLDLSDAA